MESLLFSVIIIIGAAFLPSPSIEHFIWPLSWCLLADICNHTWIPECGLEFVDNVTDLRMFIDECDMYEFNCDNDREYEMVNYSDCFKPAMGCPTRPRCPSVSPCEVKTKPTLPLVPKRYMFFTPVRRRNGGRGRFRTGPIPPLPNRMLKGKRRYTPIPRNRRWNARRTVARSCTIGCGGSTKSMKKPVETIRTVKTAKKTGKTTTFQTVILKRETIFRSGKKLLRIVKGIAWRSGKPLKIVAENHDPDSTFLE